MKRFSFDLLELQLKYDRGQKFYWKWNAVLISILTKTCCGRFCRNNIVCLLSDLLLFSNWSEWFAKLCSRIASKVRLSWISLIDRLDTDFFWQTHFKLGLLCFDKTKEISKLKKLFYAFQNFLKNSSRIKLSSHDFRRSLRLFTAQNTPLKWKDLRLIKKPEPELFTVFRCSNLTRRRRPNFAETFSHQPQLASKVRCHIVIFER